MDVSKLLDALKTQPQQGMDRKGVSETSKRQPYFQDGKEASFEKELDSQSSTTREAKSAQDVMTKDNDQSVVDRKEANQQSIEKPESKAIQAEQEDDMSSKAVSDRSESDINSNQLQDDDLQKVLEAMASGEKAIAIGDESIELPELSPEDRDKLISLLQAWQAQNGQAAGSNLKEALKQLSDSSREKIDSMLQKFAAANSEKAAEDLAQKPVENKHLLEQMQKMRDVQANAQKTMMKMEDFTSLGKVSPESTSHGKVALEEANPKGLAEKNPQLVEQQKAAGSLKDLSSTLFVQKSLGGQMESNMLQNKASQFVAKAPEMQNAFAGSVRSNLFEDMKGQVTQFVSKQQGGQMSLKLRPGNLGEVKIQIEVSKDAVRLQMNAEKPAAEQVLKSQVNELRQQLVGAGLKVEDLQISQSSKNNQMSQNDQNSEQRGSQQKEEGHDGRKQNPNEQNQQQDRRSFDEFQREQSVA